MTRHDDIPGRIKATFQDVSGSPERHKRKDTLPPFSLRLSFEERSRLEKEAGDLPLGTYIRDKLFEGAPTKRRLRKQPVKDHAALGRVLGELGQGRLSNNLNQLARAVNSGSLPVTPETEKDIRNACAEIAWMRQVLMQALGLHP
jgi:hypothetical protein